MARIKGETEDKTFVYMWSGAQHMLNLARQSLEGQVYTLIAAQVYAAFMFEAYLNHLGALKHADWSKKERQRSRQKKFQLLLKGAGLSVDMNNRPYSSISELFTNRDSMAHGKTEMRLMDKELQAHLSIAQSLASSGWQAWITVEQTEILFADAVETVRILHRKSGYHGDPFATSGGGVYSLSL